MRPAGPPCLWPDRPPALELTKLLNGVCVAVDCHLAHQSEEQIPGLPSVQWVILRGGGNYNPCRVYSAEEAERILAGAEKLICEAFASYAEVNCFCLGAGCWVPRLLSWRSRD